MVFIVDEIMGAGKSSAAINHINNSHNSADERFIVITPYLDEVDRYIESCKSRRFKQPISRRGSKLNDIKELIKRGFNIVSTHSLFQRFDEETIKLCKSLNYTLILDEVAEVVQEYNITQDDINNLLNNYCYLDDSGKLVWRADCQSYNGKFSEIKNLCNLGGIAIVRNTALLWLFPVEVFKAFKDVYILTYMFNAQIQRYYYDYYGISYQYIHVKGKEVDINDGESINESTHESAYITNYHFDYHFDYPNNNIRYDYSKLINIIDNPRLNDIGEEPTDLSKSWYDRFKDTALIKQLQNNTSNFFRHIRNDNTKDNLWTTFKDYKPALSGKGYTRGFIPINMRATNLYRDRTSVAYLVNIFLHPMVKGFFQDHNVVVDEDGYALSEMLQFIWRSAVRDGNPIWIYVPSRRMRELLQRWITSTMDCLNDGSDRKQQIINNE